MVFITAPQELGQLSDFTAPRAAGRQVRRSGGKEPGNPSNHPPGTLPRAFGPSSILAHSFLWGGPCVDGQIWGQWVKKARDPTRAKK